MSWLQSLLYGLFSGLSELIPVSSSAHQYLLLKLFGIDKADPVLNLLIHATIIFAIISACRSSIDQLLRSGSHSRRKASRNAEGYDLRFIKTATIPMCLGLLVFQYVFSGGQSLADVAIFSLINGIILFLPSRALQGNKDARSMSSLDSAATGLLSAFSVLPGISRTAVSVGVPVLRGADRQAALNWALLLSIPALGLMTVMDLVEMFAAFQSMSFVVYLGYLLAIAGAYIGSYGAISLLRFLAVRIGFFGFAYYSWGVALFAFSLYLI